ncbi:MAG: hypothetical protein D6681_15885, partial [Calditrichaeota bacterium]
MSLEYDSASAVRRFAYWVRAFIAGKTEHSRGGASRSRQSEPEQSSSHSNAFGAEASRKRPNAPGRGREVDPRLAEYYANLEVPYGSDLPTVRRAWRNLLRRYHPDRFPDDPQRQALANELIKQLNHA